MLEWRRPFAWSPRRSRTAASPRLTRRLSSATSLFLASGECPSRRLRIREDAAALFVVERVAPQRLHRETARGERRVRRRALTRGDPRALVAVLGTTLVQPAAVRKLVGHSLGHLVTADDGDPGISAQSIEVGAAARACVGDVREVSVGHVADRRAGCAVVRAVLCPKPSGVVPRCCGDYVLYAGVARARGVPEVLCGADGLSGQLRLPGASRSGGRVVIPESGKNATRITSGSTRTVAKRRAACHALAILGNAVQPRTAAGTGVEGLQNACLTARVVVVPLRAPENQIDLGGRLDADATDSAMVGEIT